VDLDVAGALTATTHSHTRTPWPDRTNDASDNRQRDQPTGARVRRVHAQRRGPHEAGAGDDAKIYEPAPSSVIR
jgi:hypothetical protein